VGSARRQEILDAALAIVDDGDLSSLTISRLAAVSGAANGSIYHHFGSRGGVLAALYRESFRRCTAALLPALDDRPAAAVVPDLARRFLDWVVAEPTSARFLYAASTGADLAGEVEEIQRFKAEVFAPVAEWMSGRMAAGELRPLPGWALDPVVMGSAHESARRFLAAPLGFDMPAARELVADATWAIVDPTQR
jgi:AcrR family transcriptional regulator